MIKKIILGSILLLLSIGHISAQCVSFNDEGPVGSGKLSGYVLTEREWGPPNFGEDPKTDSTFTATLIKLDTPLTFCDPADASFYQTKVIDCVQIFDDGTTPVSPYIGKHVITGNVGFTSSGTYSQVSPVAIDNGDIHIDNIPPLSAQELAALKNYRCQSTGGGIRLVQ